MKMTPARSVCALALMIAAQPAFAEPIYYQGIFDAETPAAAAQSAAPIATNLEKIAASDPNLNLSKNEAGEVDGMAMSSDVFFGFGEAQLSQAAQATLKSLASELASAGRLTITGHTDSIGAERPNFRLGMQRANAVRNWLIEQAGIAPENIGVASAGETRPIADNVTANGQDNAEARALNRRVEFTFKTGQTQQAASVKPTATEGVL